MKSALKLGYTSVLDRCTNDVAFALRSTERGLTRSAMLLQDAIATAVLPNPGRSSEQTTMGVGAQGSMQYGAGATAASTARLLFLRADPAALSQGQPHQLDDGSHHGGVVAWGGLLPQ